MKNINALYRISQVVSNTEEPRKALQLILDEIIDALRASSASVTFINPDSHTLEIEVSKGLPAATKELQLEMGQGVTGWVALHGKPLRVDDVEKDSRYVNVKESIRSEMAVPMFSQGSVIGVVNVDSDRLGAWSQNDLEELEMLTNEASRVISQVWLVEQMRTKAHQLETLLGVTSKLVSKLEPDELLRIITRGALDIMRCRMCALFLLKEDGRTLELQSIEGAREPIEYKEELQLEDSAVGTAIRHLRQVEVTDLRKTEEHHFITVAQREGLASLLCTPIFYEDKAIGVLNAYTEKPHRFSNDEKAITSALASHSAVAINNARLYARVFNQEETLRNNEKLTTLGLLAAEIAHEIRNPLTVIKLLFDSLELEFDNEDPRARDVTIISEKLLQLEDIVSRVLSFGKSRQSDVAKHEVCALIEDTFLLVRLKLQQNKINLHFSRSSSPLVIEGSKGQLQQVFLNLVINAMQAMPEGGEISVVCELEEDAKRQRFAKVEISDTGSGIDTDIQGVIFDTFFTSTSEGAGLGLAIVKRILHSHRGDIKIEKSDMTGTTMRVRIPLAD